MTKRKTTYNVTSNEDIVKKLKRKKIDNIWYAPMLYYVPLGKDYTPPYRENKKEEKNVKDTTDKIKKTPKKEDTPEKKNKYKLRDMIKSDKDLDTICDVMEQEAPKCKGITELDRRVADIVLTEAWGYPKFYLTKEAGDDNIRNSLSDIAHGDHKYAEVSNNHVIMLADGTVLNNPTQEAYKRNEDRHAKEKEELIDPVTDDQSNKEVVSPIFFFDETNTETNTKEPKEEISDNSSINNMSDEQLFNIIDACNELLRRKKNKGEII